MVSMNMWAGYPDFLQYIDEGFSGFLDKLNDNPQKKEYLLPNIVAELLEKRAASVKVLGTSGLGLHIRKILNRHRKVFH